MMTFGTRRKRLHAELDMLVTRFITGHYGQNVKAAKAQFNDAVKKLNRELKSNNSAERKEKLLRLVLGKVGIQRGMAFNSGTGVVDFEMMGNIFKTHAETMKWRDGSDQLSRDLAHAKDELRDLSRLPQYIFE